MKVTDDDYDNILLKNGTCIVGHLRGFYLEYLLFLVINCSLRNCYFCQLRNST